VCDAQDDQSGHGEEGEEDASEAVGEERARPGGTSPRSRLSKVEVRGRHTDG
jgi:hypothetical protein